jgi:hypothetical protein
LRFWSKKMTKEQIFSVWASEESAWSRWVKPVLFAHISPELTQLAAMEPVPDPGWSALAAEQTALVLDLPGAEGVFAGIALARRGYRPIPLYNAVPAPVTSRVLEPLSSPRATAVDVLPIIAALKGGAQELVTLKLAPDAPPAFLLDANRAGDGRRIGPGEFDNRSVSFTTDFPSANFLCSRGIRRVILVQKIRSDPQRDLAHSLRRWQEGGISLERKRLDAPGPPVAFSVSRPRWYGAMFQRALAAIGLRRARGGGFGSWVPESSSGG